MRVSFYRLLNPKSFVIGSLLKLCIYASDNKHFPRDGRTPVPLCHISQIYDYACFNTVGLKFITLIPYKKHKFNNNYISFNILRITILIIIITITTTTTTTQQQQ